MTRKINHAAGAGKRFVLKINGNTVRDYTVPANKILRIKAREVGFFEPGTRIQVEVNGVERLDYTVPNGMAAIIETEVRPV